MAVNCDPNALMQAAACYKCIPVGMQQEVMVYLLANLLNSQTGASTDPAYLIAQAKCYKCIPSGAQDEVITYLLCQIANAVGA